MTDAFASSDRNAHRPSSPDALAGECVVETTGLTKSYGDFTALRRCDLCVWEGEVFGLLGPNGAGKTTLLRLLLGFLFPTRGRATVGGLDTVTDSVAVRRLVSYLPGDARLPRHMRGLGVLEFFSRMQPDGDLQRSRGIAERLDLDLKPRVAFMSTGMRQKLALAAVLGARTPLLILDEPTANLDPTVRGDVLQMVSDARREGRTVMFSSHVLTEIEEVCDRVAFLRRGDLVRQQRMEDLKQRHRIVARVPGAVPEIPPTLADQVLVSTDGEAGIVRIETAGDLAPLLAWLSTLGLQRMRVEPLGLRSIYDAVHRAEPDEGERADGATAGTGRADDAGAKAGSGQVLR